MDCKMHPDLPTGFQKKKHVDKNRNGQYSDIKLRVLTQTNQHKAQYFMKQIYILFTALFPMSPLSYPGLQILLSRFFNLESRDRNHPIRYHLLCIQSICNAALHER
jgi:hypothetical protein